MGGLRSQRIWGNGGALLREALTEAQEGNVTVLMPRFRYDMGGPDGAGMVEKWWQLEIMPVGKLVDRPQYLITTTNDITQRVFREKQTAVEQASICKSFRVPSMGSEERNSATKVSTTMLEISVLAACRCAR